MLFSHIYVCWVDAFLFFFNLCIHHLHFALFRFSGSVFHLFWWILTLPASARAFWTTPYMHPGWGNQSCKRPGKSLMSSCCLWESTNTFYISKTDISCLFQQKSTAKNSKTSQRAILWNLLSVELKQKWNVMTMSVMTHLLTRSFRLVAFSTQNIYRI